MVLFQYDSRGCRKRARYCLRWVPFSHSVPFSCSVLLPQLIFLHTIPLHSYFMLSISFDGGLFLVREGRTKGTFALSWCHEQKVTHTLIVRAYAQWKFEVTMGGLLHLRGKTLFDLIESKSFRDVLMRVEHAGTSTLNILTRSRVLNHHPSAKRRREKRSPHSSSGQELVPLP